LTHKSISQTTEGAISLQYLKRDFGCYTLDLTPLIVEKHLSYAGEDFAQDVKQLHQQVREHIEKQNRKYKERVDKRRKKVIFKEGDLVWIQLGKVRFPARRFGKL
jgi:hypothetical protein